MRSLILLVFALLPQERATVSGKVGFPDDGKAKDRPKARYPGRASREAPRDPPPAAALVYLEGPPAAPPRDEVVEIRQEGLQFRPRAVAVQRGMRVSFPNLDKEYHNVFSYSKPKRFDLGRYPQGETREVKLDQPGLVRVYCEIHEHMRAYVLVVDHRYYAAAEADGRFSIADVPPGVYTLVAWHERFEPVRRRVEVKTGRVEIDVTFTRAAAEPGRPDRLTGCCGSDR